MVDVVLILSDFRFYCKWQVRCVRCGKGHNLKDCPVKDNPAQAVCANCKCQHSAAFKGCVKYQEVSKALKITVVDKVSYAQLQR